MSPVHFLRLRVHIIVTAVALAAVLSACSFDYGDQPPPGTDIPDAVFEGFERTEISDGKTSFVAGADRAEYYAGEKRLELTGITFEERKGDGGGVSASGEADKGTYFEDTGDAKVSGYIHVYSATENADFETDYLQYSGATHALDGGPDHTVLVRVGKKLFLKGAGFHADTQEKTFAFRDGVEGTIWYENTTKPAPAAAPARAPVAASTSTTVTSGNAKGGTP